MSATFTISAIGVLAAALLATVSMRDTKTMDGRISPKVGEPATR
jgi:hypothetical protein